MRNNAFGQEVEEETAIQRGGASGLREGADEEAAGGEGDWSFLRQM